jgi:hypothetical protein
VFVRVKRESVVFIVLCYYLLFFAFTGKSGWVWKKSRAGGSKVVQAVKSLGNCSGEG